MLIPRTSARSSSRSTWITSPVRPLSRPVSTTTLSPLRIFAAITAPPGRCRPCESSPPSQHLRGERNDLHVVLGAQLARHRAEDARADRLGLGIDQHRRVAVEPDDRAVRPPDVLAYAHHHGLHHLALLNPPTRDRLLDRDHDHVADRRVFALRSAQHLDAHDAARTGIVRDVEIGLHLNHDAPRPCSRARGASLRLLLAPHHPPALELGDRPMLLDPHDVAHREFVLLVMGVIVLGTPDRLLQQRVGEATFDAHHHGLFLLVAHHYAL